MQELERCMGPYYHITREKDLPGIKEHGLIPQIGPRSMEMGEHIPAVFLFSDHECMEDGLDWLGDLFPEDEPLVCLEVRLPDTYRDAVICDPNTEWETQCRKTIPWEFLSIKEKL